MYADIEPTGTMNEAELFEIEVDRRCHALEKYSGEVHSPLVYFAIRDLQAPLDRAVRSQIFFDILDVSLRLSRSAKYLTDERDICFEILRVLPDPRSLDENAQFTLAQIVDQVEQAYGGALEYMGWLPRP